MIDRRRQLLQPSTKVRPAALIDPASEGLHADLCHAAELRIACAGETAPGARAWRTGLAAGREAAAVVADGARIAVVADLCPRRGLAAEHLVAAPRLTCAIAG